MLLFFMRKPRPAYGQYPEIKYKWHILRGEGPAAFCGHRPKGDTNNYFGMEALIEGAPEETCKLCLRLYDKSKHRHFYRLYGVPLLTHYIFFCEGCKNVRTVEKADWWG